MAEYRDPTPISPREPEYDKTKVSKEVANYSKQVREKIKGHDVREALARNSEIADIKAEDAVATSYDTKTRQDDVENRFDDQIAGNTDIDEVIDARRPEGEEAYPTLRRRLDAEHQEVTTQLAQTEKQINDIYINIKDFGAIESDNIDSTQAIQEANDYCEENNKTLYAIGNYLIKDTLNITANCDLSMATFIYKGENIAVQVGKQSSTTRLKTFKLPSVIKKTRTWLLDNVGIKFINLMECNVHIEKISNFGIGSFFTSFSKACAYNNVYIKHLENNKVNLLIKPSDIGGWVNENVFYGGRFSHLSAMEDDLMGSHHIKLDMFDNNGYQPNNNLFIKPSLEGPTPYYTLDIKGRYNTVLQGRFEGYNRRIIFRENSAENNILHGYGVAELSVTEETGAKWNSVVSNRKTVLTGSSNQSLQTLKNEFGMNAPLLTHVGLSGNPYEYTPTNYYYQQSEGETKFKRQEDDHPRILLKHSNGSLYFGNGESEPEVFLSQFDDMLYTKGLRTSNHNWEKPPLRLGNYRMWVDGQGKLRMKNSLPTSDTDGKIVGSE